MQNNRCEAFTVTGCLSFGETGSEREGDRCHSHDTEAMLLDGELRCLCWTHRQTALAGTRELALVPARIPASYKHASDVAAAE